MSSRRGTMASMHVEVDPYAPEPPPGEDELPFEDGQPMESTRHRDQMSLLITTLRAWPARDDFYVSGNMFVHFELPEGGEYFRGPDVFVVLDASRRDRKSWFAWVEGGRLPDIVIELLSPSTQRNDRGEKKNVYERVWHTGHYVVYDPYSNVLEGWELHGGRYVAIPRDARGDLPISSLGLALGVRDGDYENSEHTRFLRWVDPTGARLPTGAERAEAERTRAEAERTRAEAAERRIAELEAALRDR